MVLAYMASRCGQRVAKMICDRDGMAEARINNPSREMQNASAFGRFAPFDSMGCSREPGRIRSASSGANRQSPPVARR
jgi:hypothetical protein